MNPTLTVLFTLPLLPVPFFCLLFLLFGSAYRFHRLGHPGHPGTLKVSPLPATLALVTLSCLTYGVDPRYLCIGIVA